MLDRPNLQGVKRIGTPGEPDACRDLATQTHPRDEPASRSALIVDNLTDRRYYVYYPYPSRTYLVEAKFHL